MPLTPAGEAQHHMKGELARMTRAARGVFTQDQFADILGIARLSVNELEGGKRYAVLPVTAIKLEEMSGVPAIEWLYAGQRDQLARYLLDKAR